MTLDRWAALIVSMITIVVAFTGAVRWLVKHYLSELKPNGGKSLADRLTAVETQVWKIYELMLEQKYQHHGSPADSSNVYSLHKDHKPS